MILMGDIGGFSSTLLLLPTIIMNFYSSRSFIWETAKDILIKENQPNKPKEPNDLQKRLTLGTKLSTEDVLVLGKEVDQVKQQKISWLKSIFFIKCLCKRDRRAMHLQKKSFENFEEHLDIRKLVHTNTNLDLLIKLLFNK